MPVSVRIATASIPSICVLALACLLRTRGSAGEGVCARADQREQTPVQRALVQLHAVADLEAADHVEQRLERRALGVEEQFERSPSGPVTASTRRSPSILPLWVRNAA